MSKAYEKSAKGPNAGSGGEYIPLVSVLTPIWNRINFLDSIMQCVLNQTYKNIEHVFVDGGSTDGTMEALVEYQAKYPSRIKIVKGELKGVGHALRSGYKACTGDIISWIDSDDLYEPDAVETAVNFFRDNPDAYFLYGDCYLLNADGTPNSCFIIKDFNLKEALDVWHYLIIPAVFYKREVIEKVGYLNNLGNDLDFYVRASKHFKLHRIRKVLGGWRAQPESISFGADARAVQIRLDRHREDFFLILRYGGSLRAPKALLYYSLLNRRLMQYSAYRLLMRCVQALRRLRRSVSRG